VIAGTCVEANTAATAAIIRGADADAWLAGLGLAARLVSTAGAVRYTGRWPVPLAAARA
jgi:thiamine biosynthesis lipoprotein